MSMRLCSIAFAREDRYYNLAGVGDGSFGQVHRAVDVRLGGYTHQIVRFSGSPSASRNMWDSAATRIFQIAGSPRQRLIFSSSGWGHELYTRWGLALRWSPQMFVCISRFCTLIWAKAAEPECGGEDAPPAKRGCRERVAHLPGPGPVSPPKRRQAARLLGASKPTGRQPFEVCLPTDAHQSMAHVAGEPFSKLGYVVEAHVVD
jgi:hypothetical protein